MPLPEKEYYSLAEVAERWHTPPQDLRYYAAHGYFRVKAWISEEVVKILQVVETKDGRTVPMQAGFTSYRNYAVLAPEDLRRIFKGDLTPIQRFTTPDDGKVIELYNCKDRYVFTTDDLVVSRRERDRFEQTYTLPCPCENLSERQDMDPCRAISFGGRPSSMYRVLQHFAERCDSCLLLPSLQKEADYLADWALRTIKDAQTPKSRTIMNTIRSDYRQQINVQSKLPRIAAVEPENPPNNSIA